MAQEIHDRLSGIPKSEFWRGNKAIRGLHIALDGVEVSFATEYCISEGWVDRILRHPETQRPYVDTSTGALAIGREKGLIKVWYDNEHE